MSEATSSRGHTFLIVSPGSANWGGRLSTVDLLIKAACFVKKVNNIFKEKGADLNLLVHGGQLYWAFPFSKTSLVSLIADYF